MPPAIMFHTSARRVVLLSWSTSSTEACDDDFCGIDVPVCTVSMSTPILRTKFKSGTGILSIRRRKSIRNLRIGDAPGCDAFPLSSSTDCSASHCGFVDLGRSL